MSLKSKWTAYRRRLKKKAEKYIEARREEGQMALVLAGTYFGGTAVGGAVAGTITTLKARNQAERDRRALKAAATERAQAIKEFQRDIAAGGELGLQFTPGVQKLIPLILILGIVAYVIFKD